MTENGGRRRQVETENEKLACALLYIGITINMAGWIFGAKNWPLLITAFYFYVGGALTIIAWMLLISEWWTRKRAARPEGGVAACAPNDAEGAR